jgi:hypothetical protein
LEDRRRAEKINEKKIVIVDTLRNPATPAAALACPMFDLILDTAIRGVSVE